MNGFTDPDTTAPTIAAGAMPIGSASPDAASPGTGSRGSESTAYSLRRGTISLGRSRHSDIVIDDPLASRRHAELLVAPGGVEIVDLESSNGTFVNGRRILRQPVREADTIAIGHHVFQLQGVELVGYIRSGVRPPRR